MSTKSIWFLLCDKNVRVQGKKHNPPPPQSPLKVKFSKKKSFPKFYRKKS
jgi:hypothetical protein